MGLHPDLLDGLDDMGFLEATPIQEKAIPAALDGKDLLAVAQTGTGKTGAFLLPVLDRLCDGSSKFVDTLIITPTRELAMQIEGQIVGLSYYTGASSISVYGGRDGKALDQERKAMKLGVDIIVATPGRLKTHLQMGHLDLSKLKTLILDEADRMLDMGFIGDIMEIVKKLPKSRQTLLFSATFPPKIQKLAQELINEERKLEIRIAISKPPEAIKQQAYYIDDRSKDALVAHLLRERTELKRAIVFCNRKTKVRELARTLQRKGLNVASVESGMEQKDREQVLRSFKNGTIQTVVATDVLSRGIDVKAIELVINYDVPGGGEDYVHRIGRTARADTTGEAITLVSSKDKRDFQAIEELIGKKVDTPELPDWLKPRSGGGDRRDDRRDGNRGGGNRGGGNRGGGNRSGGDNRSGGGNRNSGGGRGRGPKPQGNANAKREGGPRSEGAAKSDQSGNNAKREGGSHTENSSQKPSQGAE